jgi:hypothetical protein
VATTPRGASAEPRAHGRGGLRVGGEDDSSVARFSWELVPADGGESLVEGFAVAVTDDDGRISSVLGFLDKMPGA